MTAPEADTKETLETLRSDQWQRLAPAAIIHFMVKFIVGFAKNGIQNVAYLGGIAIFTGDNRWMILGGIATLAAVVLVAGGVLSYINFRFRLEGQSFLIRRGVMNKKRLTLSFDRIQNVALKEPVYFRPFGLVALILESAGSSGEEVSLAGIPKTLAIDIRQTVLARPASLPREQNTSEQGETETEEKAGEEDTLLLAQPASELARYGLSNNNIWVVAGVATGALFQQFDQWEHEAEAFIDSTIIPFVGDDPTMLGIVFVMGILGIILLLMLFSVLGAIILHFDYRLSYGNNRYHRTKGLFEKQETSVPEAKVQSLQIAQPWPARLMGRWHLTLRQIGFSSTENMNGGKQTPFLVPSVRTAFYQALVDRLFGKIEWQHLEFIKIHRLYIWKTLTYWFLLPVTVLSISLYLLEGPAGLLPLLVPLIVLPAIFLRHGKFGYWSNGEIAMVRRGFVGSRQTVFAFRKAQTVKLTQSPSQRRRKLATLAIQLAGQTITIPYMPYQEAAIWRDRILFEIESRSDAWM